MEEDGPCRGDCLSYVGFLTFLGFLFFGTFANYLFCLLWQRIVLRELFGPEDRTRKESWQRRLEGTRLKARSDGSPTWQAKSKGLDQRASRPGVDRETFPWRCRGQKYSRGSLVSKPTRLGWHYGSGGTEASGGNIGTC